MPYVVSKLASSQIYTQYAKGLSDNVNIPIEQVEIKGGADVTDKNLIIPQGVMTKITDCELDILKSNKEFQRHLEKGHMNYFGITPNIEKIAPKMTEDKSRQLTPDDYKKEGKKAPKSE